MTAKAKITELITTLLPDESFFLVDVEVGASRIKTKVTVLVDNDRGISIDECAELSRKLGHQLEELNLFENPYTLEVSSPGVDFPLTQLRQFQRNIGRKLRIQLISGSESIGTLESATETSVTIVTDATKKVPAQTITVPYTDIKKAQVLVSFK